MLLIVNNGWFYCFCNKCHRCEHDFNKGRLLCPLCQIQFYLNNFEEVLDQCQFDIYALKKFGFKLFLLLLECYTVDKRSLEAFREHYYYSTRDRYTGEKLRPL